MSNKQTWKEFQETGLIWWINRQLHLFGWALFREEDEYGNIINVYPARTKFRGFEEALETKGFVKLSKYLKENIKEIERDTREE